MSELPALAVVVLYRTAPEQSATLRALAAARAAGAPMPRVLLVFDNLGEAEHAQSDILRELGARYLRSATNQGIRAAYEEARRMAAEMALDWLWLFDQDSDLDPGFAAEMAHALERFAGEMRCVAICPTVLSGPRRISPVGDCPLPAPGSSVLLEPGAHVGAINAGCLVRRAFVDQLGGFDARLWLDGLDHWLFLTIRAHGQCVAVAGARLAHDLSVVAHGDFVSPERYRSILDSERILYREFYSPVEKAKYLLRLAFRCFKHPLRYRSFRYLMPTLRQLGRLTFSARRA